MQSFVIVCIAILLLVAAFIILNAGLDQLATLFMSLTPVQQLPYVVVAVVSVLLLGATLLQSGLLARQRKTIGTLTDRLYGVRQSSREVSGTQTDINAVLERVVGTDPEEALTTLSKQLTEAERATMLQQSHNEAVDLESRADDIRRRQQALRGRLGEVFDKRRLVEPIFGELKERQSIILRALEDFDKSEGGKSLETHLAELTDFVRRTEDRFLAFDQGLGTLDQIKTEITRLQGRIAPFESADAGIRSAIQVVSGLCDQLAGTLDSLEQDGDRKVSQRVRELADKTRELEQRVASLCDHFVMLDAVRTDIGILFTRLNVELATHSPSGSRGQYP